MTDDISSLISYLENRIFLRHLIRSGFLRQNRPFLPYLRGKTAFIFRTHHPRKLGNFFFGLSLRAPRTRTLYSKQKMYNKEDRSSTTNIAKKTAQRKEQLAKIYRFEKCHISYPGWWGGCTFMGEVMRVV